MHSLDLSVCHSYQWIHNKSKCLSTVKLLKSAVMLIRIFYQQRFSRTRFEQGCCQFCFQDSREPTISLEKHMDSESQVAMARSNDRAIRIRKRYLFPNRWIRFNCVLYACLVVGFMLKLIWVSLELLPYSQHSFLVSGNRRLIKWIDAD